MANFFSGELALLDGSKQEAARLFRIAANDCPRKFGGQFLANAELKALGLKPYTKSPQCEPIPKPSLRGAKRRSNPGAAKRLWIASPAARNDGRGHDLLGRPHMTPHIMSHHPRDLVSGIEKTGGDLAQEIAPRRSPSDAP